MSSRIWTQAELQSELRKYAGTVWRCVEAQHRVSTMRLVDNTSEQAILERVLEETKPPLPLAERHLDFLLLTPFRYDPHRSGSRFRRRGSRQGAFYASEDVETALCEIAFYKYLFLADAPEAEIPLNPIEHTAFSVACQTSAALDLTEPPLSSDRVAWESLSDYESTQRLGDTAREAGVHLIRFLSVRDLLRRANVVLLDTTPFATTAPTGLQSWRVLIKPDAIVALCEFPRREIDFPLMRFSADARLAPLIERLKAA